MVWIGMAWYGMAWQKAVSVSVISIAQYHNHEDEGKWEKHNPRS